MNRSHRYCGASSDIVEPAQGIVEPAHTFVQRVVIYPPLIGHPFPSISVAALRRDWGKTCPPNRKSRQKLSKQNGIKLVGYTFIIIYLYCYIPLLL